MSDDEESVAEPPDADQPDDPTPSAPVEDPKIGSLSGKLRELFPPLYHTPTVVEEMVDGEEREDEEGLEEDGAEPAAAEVRSIVEIPSECVEEEGSSPNPLPYPVTEEARLRAEAAQKLDDLTARQAEEEIAALQELLAERMTEQKDADETTRREMKEVHGLDWGRQIPKERILLDR
ncbi:hypothetical protein FOZ62_006094 [Perkinsus olseni]|uniref:Uncharacterized protein n=1 Tax=Perkinsus olseni TaxID=32597 RepID=A0A7J6PZM0_PEROL|nr:hypothetical protein FOZ62_006094 [Perkinsus olseni]